MSEAIATIEHREDTLSVEGVIQRIETIQDLMKRAMTRDIDYGVVPGTKSKPTLLKPGAEKLCVMFRFSPRYATEKTFHEGGHLTVESTCRIYDMANNLLGESSAMCSTKESKYAWRNAERVCPQCGKPCIIKGKAEYGGGFLCFGKKGGCGAKFAETETRITNQETGRVQNPDIADSYNTVLRIAEKRALIAAVRLVTGSSSLFDEEMPQEEHREHHESPHAAPTNGHAPNGHAPKEPSKAETPKPYLDPALVQVVRLLLVKHNIPEAQAIAWASAGKVADMNDLTTEQADRLIQEYRDPDKATMDVWTTALADVTIDSINQAWNECKMMSTGHKAAIKALIKSAADRNSFGWDKAANAFVEMQPA